MYTTNLWHQLNLSGKKIIIAGSLFILACFFNDVYAQRQRVINLPDYDRKTMHYGFQIGVFQSTMALKHSEYFASVDNPSPESVISVNPISRPGFSLGFVANFALKDELWDLRLLPNVSFYNRALEYTFANGQTETLEKEMTFVEVPFMLKYKSMRRGNHRMFMQAGLTGGVKVGGKKEEEGQDENFDFNRYNLEVSYGFGFHFYMQMFNFSPEIRFSHGLVNLFKRPSQSNEYSQPIERLTTHKITLFLNFEG
ncbi:porin family protein [Rapidithrix thailandica]|uniref:Porin family protein n=1 Tax=Rapidithrix thailandica TaxID=413964 RepID=A0AAW9SHX2_9BACT